MAVRQYVGARYVPKFADPVAWQSGTSYEALTIVTYNNSSYTSKIPVPATVGNPADNSDYWALTGNYNAQVEAYREETVAVQEGLNEEITNREQAVSAEAQAREAADTALSERITNLLNYDNFRECICIGDSYGRGYYNGEDHINQGWPAYLANLTHGNIYNYSVGGAGFATGTTFYQQLQTAHGEHPEASTIIIAGGTNDLYYSGDDLFNLVTTCVQYAQTNFVNAKIYVMINSIAYDSQFDINKKITTWNAIKNACLNTGIPFTYVNIDLRFVSDTMSSDYHHPNAFGYRMLAYFTYLALIGVKVQYQNAIHIHSGSPNMYIYPHGETCTVTIRSTTAPSYTVGDTLYRCNGDAALITLANDRETAYPKLFEDTGTFVMHTDCGFTNLGFGGTANIKLTSDGIIIAPYILNITDSGVVNYKAIEANTSGQIYLNEMTAEIPSLYFC